MASLIGKATSARADAECYIKSNHIVSSGVHDIKVDQSGECQLLKVEPNNLVFADSTFASNNTLGYGFANFVCATGELPAVMSVLRRCWRQDYVYFSLLAQQSCYGVGL